MGDQPVEVRAVDGWIVEAARRSVAVGVEAAAAQVDDGAGAARVAQRLDATDTGDEPGMGEGVAERVVTDVEGRASLMGNCLIRIHKGEFSPCD